MRKTLLHQLLLLALLCLLGSATAQYAEEDGVFAFAYNPFGKQSSATSIPQYKISTAHKVFDKLVAAKGVRNMPKPTLILDNAEQRPAWANPDKALIAIEEKAFDICISMGKDSLNALAALLGHELIHYYEKHNWKEEFTSDHVELGFADTEGDRKELEYQADHLGGLLTHMAGYKTLGILPKLMTKIYTAYGLDTQEVKGYPSLEERLSLTRKSDTKLTEHSRLFDMSIYLTATGEYRLAVDYLNHLLLETKFQSREIYNNLGALQLLQVIQAKGAQELPYFFPIELEITSRLNRRNTNNSSIEQLLDEASYNLKNAIILDEEYIPAYVNLSVLYVLQEKWLDASYHLQKAEQKLSATSATSSDIAILRGIISAMQGDTGRGREYFIAAQSELGRRNLCVLDKRGNCNPPINKKKRNTHSIDQVDLNQLFARIMQDKEQASISIDLDLTNSFHTIAKEHSEIFVQLDQINLGDYVFYQVVENPKINYKLDLHVGSTVQQLKNTLGNPSAVIRSFQNEIWSYKSSNLFFIINEKGTISKWCMYKSTMS